MEFVRMVNRGMNSVCKYVHSVDLLYAFIECLWND